MKKLMLVMAVLVFASAPAFAVTMTTVCDWDMSSATGVGGTLTLMGNASISGGKLNLDGTSGTYAWLATTPFTANEDILVEAIFSVDRAQWPSVSQYRVFENGVTPQVYGQDMIVRTSPDLATGMCTWRNYATPASGLVMGPGTGIVTYALAMVVDRNAASPIYHYFSDGTTFYVGTNSTPNLHTTTGGLSIGAGGQGTNHFYKGTIDRVRFSTFTGTWNDATDRSNLLTTLDGSAGPPPAPEANVKGNGVDIADGDAIPSLGDHTDFGSTLLGTPITRTFTVENLGTAALTTSGLSVPAGFSIFEGLSASIGAGLSDTFTVQLDALVAGPYSGTVSFANNDGDENPYNFNITGIVNAPPSAVPEPSTLSLIAFGLLGVACRRRRRR